MTLEEAQAALVIAQQNLAAASASKAVADELVASASAEVARTLEERNATAVTISGTSSTTTSNVVLNGEFNNASAWSGIAMYEDYMFNNYYAAVVKDGTLIGSYSSGNFYLQTGTFVSPTRTVSFAVDVWNNNNQRNDTAYDYYRIEFRTYAADGTRLNYFNFQWGGAFHDWITRGATYNLSADAVRWDIGFRLADGGYWNGNYGPAIDNVKLFATMTTSTPDTVEYDDVAEQAYADAATSLSQAVYVQNEAQNNLTAAIAEVERLQALIVSLTPVTPPWWQVEWWEGNPVHIAIMNEGLIFSSIQAWYGDPQNTCGYDVTQSLSPLIVDYSSASFIVSNDLFGDPCPGVVKVLRFAASISQVVTESPATESPVSESQTVSDSATVSESVIVPTASPEPTPEPTATTQPEPTPVPTQEPIQPTPRPLPEPTPEPTLTPSPEPTPSPQPEPQPTPTPEPQPETSPSPQPSPEPSPTQPEAEPKPTPSVTPSPTPTVVPSQPSTPVEKPVIPTPTPEPSPSVIPTPSVLEKEPTPTEKPVVVEIKEPITAENITAVVSELASIRPQQLTTEQQTLIVEAALETFETAEAGSEEYEAALDALLVVAQADDIVLDEELAAIPLVGNVAGAAVEVFNALGNAGADMSPQVREQSEKVVIAAVIVGQVAMTATAAATSAAAAAARRP